MKRPPLEIAYWDVGVNLTTDAKWNRAHILKQFRKYKIKPGQCIALFNNSRMFGGAGYHPPKCRLFVNWAGEPITLIPAVDDNEQVSYQLRLNMWLRHNFGTEISNVDTVLDTFDSQFASRQARKKAAAKAARKLK
jgi:hypothetical protein